MLIYVYSSPPNGRDLSKKPEEENISSTMSCSFKRRLWGKEFGYEQWAHTYSLKWTALSLYTESLGVDSGELWFEVHFYFSGMLILLLAIIQCPAHIKEKKKEEWK